MVIDSVDASIGGARDVLAPDATPEERAAWFGCIGKVGHETRAMAMVVLKRMLRGGSGARGGKGGGLWT